METTRRRPRAHTRPKSRLRTVRTTRSVWEAITRTPCASVTELAQQLGCARSTVSLALQALRKAGYVRFDRGAESARQILVPFVVTKKAKH